MKVYVATFCIYVLVLIYAFLPLKDLDSGYPDEQFVKNHGGELFNSFFVINLPSKCKDVFWYDGRSDPTIHICIQTNDDDIEKQCRNIFKGVEDSFILKSDSKDEKRFYNYKNKTIVIVKKTENTITCYIEKQKEP